MPRVIFQTIRKIMLYSELNKKTLGEIQRWVMWSECLWVCKRYPWELAETVLFAKITEIVCCRKNKSYSIQTKFLQEKHQLYTVQQNKKCLSLFDDKRFLSSYVVNTCKYLFIESCYGRCQITLHKSLNIYKISNFYTMDDA